MTSDAFTPPPGWTQQDIDRFVGVSYRNLLVQAARGDVDPATALADLDRFYMNGAITWPFPTLAIRADDDWLTADEIAQECGVPTELVRVWASRGRWSRSKKPGHRTVYRWGDVKEFRARHRQLRAARHQP